MDWASQPSMEDKQVKICTIGGPWSLLKALMLYKWASHVCSTHVLVLFITTHPPFMSLVPILFLCRVYFSCDVDLKVHESLLFDYLDKPPLHIYTHIEREKSIVEKWRKRKKKKARKERKTKGLFVRHYLLKILIKTIWSNKQLKTQHLKEMIV